MRRLGDAPKILLGELPPNLPLGLLDSPPFLAIDGLLRVF